jgi:RinA family phage transcriptional activator
VDKAVFKYIEHIIREYPDVKKILETDEYYNDIILSSPSGDETGVRSGMGKPTETKALKLMTSKTRDQMARNQKAVYVVTSELPEERYRLVELYYWQRPRLLSNEGIAQELRIGTTTMYEWKRSIVKLIGIELGLENP